jgi:hypothetical protein
MAEDPAQTGSAAGGAEAAPGARSVVWMVNLKTGMSGRKGHLWLEPGILVFRPDSTSFGDTRIALERIRRVKAARFTPVMDLRLSDPALQSRMGFYFAEPPSAAPIERSGLHLTSPKRAGQREAAATLRDADLLVRADLDAWVERIKRAKRGR